MAPHPRRMAMAVAAQAVLRYQCKLRVALRHIQEHARLLAHVLDLHANRATPPHSSATRSPARASPRTPQGSRTRNTRPSVAGSPQSRSPSKRGPAATSGPTSLGPTSKFKLHFAGRVYRPLASASPKEARDMYTKEGNWIGQPDERSKENEELIDCPCGSQSGSDSPPAPILAVLTAFCFSLGLPLQSMTRR